VDLFEADAGSSMISFKFGPLFQDRSAFSDIKRSRISAVLQSSVSGKPTGVFRVTWNAGPRRGVIFSPLNDQTGGRSGSKGSISALRASVAAFLELMLPRVTRLLLAIDESLRNNENGF